MAKMTYRTRLLFCTRSSITIQCSYIHELRKRVSIKRLSIARNAWLWPFKPRRLLLGYWDWVYVQRWWQPWLCLLIERLRRPPFPSMGRRGQLLEITVALFGLHAKFVGECGPDLLLGGWFYSMALTYYRAIFVHPVHAPVCLYVCVCVSVEWVGQLHHQFTMKQIAVLLLVVINFIFAVRSRLTLGP